MYQLYLDAVSETWKIALLRGKSLIAETSISLAGNESSQLWAQVFWFLDTQALSPEALDHIYLIHWPGSFTGIRSICLIANTLAYIYPHLTLTPISFFDLYESYPIIKQSSRRDVFVKKQKDAIIETISLGELTEFLSTVSECYGSFDMSLWDFDHIRLNESYDIAELLLRIERKNTKFVEPLYIKKPNIS